MSLVISHVGWDFVTAGADRGSWDVTPNGVPSRPRRMRRSKIHTIPGAAAIIACTGAWYEGWIETWIADHPVDAAAFSLPEFARAFIADYFSYHDPRARARLAGCGMALPESGKLEPNTQARAAASSQVIVAGLQPNWPRAQIWTADYPGLEAEPLHYRVDLSKPNFREELATLYAIGQHEGLGQLVESFDGNTSSDQSIRFLAQLFDIRETLSKDEVLPTILGPYDIVRITADGVEWVSGNEGPVETAHVAALDVNGKFKSTASMNGMGVSVPVISTSGITYTSSTGSSATADSTITLYWDGTNGSTIPAIHFPSSGGSLTNCVGGNSGAISGLNASTTYYFMSRIVCGSLVIQIQTQNGGASADSADEIWLNQDGYIAFAKNMACSTPAANTGGGGTPPGGGGGGSSCPSVDQLIETQRGFIAAGEVQSGDQVRGPEGEFVPVVAAETIPAVIAKVKIADEWLFVDLQHQWRKPDGSWIQTDVLHLGELVQGADDKLYAVDGIELVGPGAIRKIRVPGSQFIIGRAIGHNVTTF